MTTAPLCKRCDTPRGQLDGCIRCMPERFKCAACAAPLNRGPAPAHAAEHMMCTSCQPPLTPDSMSTQPNYGAWLTMCAGLMSGGGGLSKTYVGDLIDEAVALGLSNVAFSGPAEAAVRWACSRPGRPYAKYRCVDGNTEVFLTPAGTK